MHDAKGVRFGERLANLQGIGDGCVDWKRAVTSHECAQVNPLEVFHHQVGPTRVELPHVHDLDDMLATQRGKRAAFVQEAFDYGRLAGERTPQELDRHRLLELRMATEAYDTHAALGKNALDHLPPCEEPASWHWYFRLPSFLAFGRS